MKNKILILVFLVFGTNFMSAQVCGTPHPANADIYPQDDTSMFSRASSDAICINIFFHIIRNSDGTSSFTTPNLDEIVKKLNEFYSPHNILINKLGYDYIDNSEYLNIGDEIEARRLGRVNNRSNAINYYIVETLWNIGSNYVTGTANSIPSNNLVIRRDRVLSSTSAHEVGHCLNLLHTHDTSRGVELINGSNCSVAGDLVCDTPADAMKGAVDGYNPDLTNIMSYYRNLDHFTNGQGGRGRHSLKKKPILQKIVSNSCVKISPINDICYPQIETVYISNIGNAKATWSSSANVEIISSNYYSAQIRALNINSDGKAWVKAVLTNGIVFQENFRVGKHKFDYLENVSVSQINHIRPVTTSSCGDIGLKLNFVHNNDNIQEIEWKKITNNFEWSQGNNINRDEYVIVSPYCKGPIKFEIRVKNKCGWSSWQSIEYDPKICYNNCTTNDNSLGINSDNFDVFPVPASSSLTVSLKNETIRFLEPGETFRITLYNDSYKVIRRVNGTESSITIDVSSIPKGTYILTIEYNDIYESHNIIIK